MRWYLLLTLAKLTVFSVQSGVPGSGKDNGATVMRGPAAATVVTQLYVLVIDATVMLYMHPQ